MNEWEVILGDSLAVMPTMPEKSFAHVITDPPFEPEAHTKGRRRVLGGPRGVLKNPLPFAHLSEEQRAEAARQIVRLSNGWALVFCQAEAVGAWRDVLVAAGASYKRAMVWVKPNGMPQLSGDRPGMGYESIVAAWCGKGASSWNGGGRCGVFSHLVGEGGVAPHPTIKPQPLMCELVRLFTNPGDRVLDPYCGSGSTLAACVRYDRPCVGIEVDKGYAELARVRVASAANHLFRGARE